MKAKKINEINNFERGISSKDSLDVGIRRGYHKKIYKKAISNGFNPIPENEWDEEKPDYLPITDYIIDIFQNSNGIKILISYDPDHTSMFTDDPPQYDALYYNFPDGKERSSGMFGPGQDSEYFSDWNWLKTINEENIDFKRGQDSKKSLGLGYINYIGYVEKKLAKHNLDPDNFWEERDRMIAESTTSYELVETIDDIMLHTPLEYQIDWIEDDLDFYIENNYIENNS